MRKILYFLVMLSACGRAGKSYAPTEPPAQPAVQLAVTWHGEDSAPDLHGLSGLARAPDGALWAIPERQDFLVQLLPQGAKLALRPIPLVGKPDDADTEDLTLWQEPGGPVQVAIATEKHGSAYGTDHILLGTLEPGKATITRSIPLDYSNWGILAQSNHGLEGLCWAGALWTVSETVVDNQGPRWAPLARRDGDKWTAGRLQLTSKDGKLSGLVCRRTADGQVELWAIERHYGVSRWLRAVAPANGPLPQPLVPTVVADLAVPTFAVYQTVPNLEGIALDPQDPQAAWLVADNDSGGGLTGPNILLRVAPNKQ